MGAGTSLHLQKGICGCTLRCAVIHCQPDMAPVIQGSQTASQAWNSSGVMPSCSRRPLASASSGTRANCVRHLLAAPQRQDVTT